MDWLSLYSIPIHNKALLFFLNFFIQLPNVLILLSVSGRDSATEVSNEFLAGALGFEFLLSNMDDKDIEILKHLSVDGRQSARQLSHRLGVSTVTILSRIKKLEEEKIIKGYSVRLNHELLGFDITAIIEIKTNKGKMLDIENEIAKNDSVIAVYDITGDADMVVIAKFKTRELLSEFIKKISAISNVENTLTHLVLNTIKEDNRLIE